MKSWDKMNSIFFNLRLIPEGSILTIEPTLYYTLVTSGGIIESRLRSNASETNKINSTLTNDYNNSMHSRGSPSPARSSPSRASPKRDATSPFRSKLPRPTSTSTSGSPLTAKKNSSSGDNGHNYSSTSTYNSKQG